MDHLGLKIKYIFFVVISNLVFCGEVFAGVKKPGFDFNLPFVSSSDNVSGKVPSFISKGIAETIKYIGLLAVLSLTIGGIMYITSFGEEAKTKKAKNVILYSVIGVVVAAMAYALVGVVNSINI